MRMILIKDIEKALAVSHKPILNTPESRHARAQGN